MAHQKNVYGAEDVGAHFSLSKTSSYALLYWENRCIELTLQVGEPNR